ncbi:MAG: hypothetical protein WKG07_17085 [Hymenobacter sp.]
MYLDGILYQPGTATYEEMRRHLHAMKALGCNLVRVHIAGIDPRIYDLADELGLLLWVEVPEPAQLHAAQPREPPRRAAADAGPDGNPPQRSSSGASTTRTGAPRTLPPTPKPGATSPRCTTTCSWHHPQFLVVDNDGWHHISHEGRLKSDLLTAHLYTPDLGRWRGAARPPRRTARWRAPPPSRSWSATRSSTARQRPARSSASGAASASPTTAAPPTPRPGPTSIRRLQAGAARARPSRATPILRPPTLRTSATGSSASTPVSWRCRRGCCIRRRGRQGSN